MRYAICNEMFGSLNFGETCRLIAAHGFRGVEIAPFTLFEDAEKVGREKMREIRRLIRESGLEFVGFHWLLRSPEGLHITTPQRAARERSWVHMRRLVDLAGELGGGVLVLGSPKQRSAAGIPVAQAVGYLREGLSELADFAAARSSTLLIEALSRDQTDVITSLAECEELVRAVGKPGLASMFDFHNCAGDPLAWEQLLLRYYPVIRHVHLNEVNGSYPGSGSSDFGPAFASLAELGYGGWVSLEIFHQPEDCILVLRAVRSFLSTMEKRCGFTPSP